VIPRGRRLKNFKNWTIRARVLKKSPQTGMKQSSGRRARGSLKEGRENLHTEGIRHIEILTGGSTGFAKPLRFGIVHCRLCTIREL